MFFLIKKYGSLNRDAQIIVSPFMVIFMIIMIPFMYCWSLTVWMLPDKKEKDEDIV